MHFHVQGQLLRVKLNRYQQIHIQGIQQQRVDRRKAIKKVENIAS